MRSAMQYAGQKFAFQRSTAFTALPGIGPTRDRQVTAAATERFGKPLPATLFGGKGEGQNTHFFQLRTLAHSAEVYPPERVKLTCTCVSTSTGSPRSFAPKHELRHPSQVPRLLPFLVFVAIALGLVGGMHYYLWARLVRDPQLPETWARELR